MIDEIIDFIKAWCLYAVILALGTIGLWCIFNIAQLLVKAL